MKIISKFKDYYDQVAHTYGGGDPKIWYDRRSVPNTSVEVTGTLALACDRLRDYQEYVRRHVVAGQRCYTVFERTRPWDADRRWFLPAPGDRIMSIKPNKYSPSLGDIYRKLGDKMFYEEHPSILNLCRLVGAPVFHITHTYRNARQNKTRVEIAEKVPRLADIRGFAKAYPANQLYQDLSYVLGNLMLEPPDNAPPVMVEEKVRFLKKGFDSKTSFRGKHT